MSVLSDNAPYEMLEKKLPFGQQNLFRKAFDGYEGYIRGLNNCLIDRGYGEKRSQVRKRNLIDISEYDTIAGHEAMARLKEEYPDLYTNWLFTLPPFEHGVLQVSKDSYITWDMEDLDLDNKEYNVILHYYTFDLCWRIGYYAHVNARIVDYDNDYTYATDGGVDASAFVDEAKKITKEEIMTYFPLDEKSLNGIDDESIERAMLYKMGSIAKVQDYMEDIFQLCLSTFTQLNALLALNKNRMKSAGKKQRVIYTDAPSEDRRKPRIINGIKVLSESKPKAHTMASIRRYKCASWTVRAHSRVYKNGRVVFIKEQARHRHNMGEVKVNAQRIILK